MNNMPPILLNVFELVPPQSAYADDGITTIAESRYILKNYYKLYTLHFKRYFFQIANDFSVVFFF